MKKINLIKEEIKRLAEEQKFLKPQWKTVNIKVFRQVKADQAAYQAFKNKFELRHLHVAYDIIRGKEPVYPKKAYYIEKKVSALVEKYSFDRETEKMEA